MNHAAKAYQKVAVQSGVDSASPHTLINMLFDGAIARLKNAASCAEAQQIDKRSRLITSALAIIDGLQASLDKDKGGSLAQNLDDLYDYMQRQLLRATIDNDAGIITEVAGLLETLRESWNAMDLTHINLPANPPA